MVTKNAAHKCGLQNYQIIANLRNFTHAFMQILRDIDNEVSHLLQLL